MPINIFNKYTKAKSGEVNNNFNLIAGNNLVAFNPIDGSPVTGFNIGDLTRVSTGSLLNSTLVRSGEELIVYNAAGVEIGRVTYDELLNQGQATTTIKGAALLPKVITIKNSTIDPNKDMEFSAGVMQFNDGSGQAATNGIIKRLDADFAIGTNQGGMPATVTKSGTYTSLGTAVTGAGSSFDTDFEVGDVIFSSSNSIGRRITAIADSTNLTIESGFPVNVSGDNVEKNGLAPNTTYYCFTISDEDGLNTDAGYDTQLDASNLLADAAVLLNTLDKFQKTASLLTDASINIRGGIYKFNRDGSYNFRHNIGGGILDFDDPTPALDVRTPFIVSAPANTLAIMQAWINDNDTFTSWALLTSSFQTDEAPSASNCTLVAGETDSVNISLLTNSSREIFYRTNDSSLDYFRVRTLGWFDNNI